MGQQATNHPDQLPPARPGQCAHPGRADTGGKNGRPSIHLQFDTYLLTYRLLTYAYFQFQWILVILIRVILIYLFLTNFLIFLIAKESLCLYTWNYLSKRLVKIFFSCKLQYTYYLAKSYWKYLLFRLEWLWISWHSKIFLVKLFGIVLCLHL